MSGEERVDEGFVVIEPVGRFSRSMYKVARIHVMKKTRYQEVMIADIVGMGRALIIDNLIQSSELDEHYYHESLVHPAMVLHPRPRRVLIIGGGEGATLREALKHGSVEKAVMVDIDGEIVEFAKQYLGFMHKGSFDDPRAEVVIMDGKKYLEEAPSGSFDVVIFDLTDPYAGEAARELYSEHVYREAYRVLGEDGVMVTQAGNSFFYPREYRMVLRNISSVFPHIMEYQAWVPVFGYACNFILASKKHDPSSLTPREVDERLRERGVETRYFDGRVYASFVYMKIV